MEYRMNFPLLIDINDPILITLFIVGVVVIVIGIFLLLYFLIFRKKQSKVKTDNNAWLTALGNKENIVEVRGIGSRLTLKLIDKEKIDRERLKELGVTSVLVMSDKVTLVVEGQAEKIASILNENL